MITALAFAIPPVAFVLLGLGGYLGCRYGRERGYREGRWRGLEEGYADAMRDGWRDLDARVADAEVYDDEEGGL